MGKESQSTSHDQPLHHVGSMTALKMLGKKILSSKNHDSAHHGNNLEAGHPVQGMRKIRGHGTHHNSTSRPKSTSPNNRKRSSSLFQKNMSSANVPALTSARSSASIHNMVAHNNNPFAPQQGMDMISSGKGVAAARKNGSGPTNHSISKRPSGNFANNHHFLNNENIIYNPYGINGNVVPSRSGSAYAGNNANANGDISFYMHDGNSKIRLLPLPIADPNDYLPDDIKQASIHMTDNFVFDSDNLTLGTGGSSEVRKIRSAYRQKDVYALKKLNMIYDENAEKFYKRCSKEFIIAKRLSHHINVCNTYYLVKVPTTTYTTRGWGFVMEICVKDLFQLMERSGWKSVPLDEKFCIFKQIAEAIKFCHEEGVAHRDLKPENVLISKDGICKLTDFGISDWYHIEPQNFNSPVKRCEGMIGSPPYTPPEVMLFDAKKNYPESIQKPYNPLKMDSYALGLILIALVNNILPFFESCNTDPRYRDFEISYENFINHQCPHFRDKNYHKGGPGSEYSLARNFKSTEASRVAWRLSDPNPDTRYSIEELYNDPWFQSIEVCVNNDDDHAIKAPEIRKSSSDIAMNSNVNSNSNSNSDFFHSDQDSGSRERLESPQHTSNPFLTAKIKPKPKPRSMVDIAQSPINKSEVASKVPSKVVEDEEDEGAGVEGTEDKEERKEEDAKREGATDEEQKESVRAEEAKESAVAPDKKAPDTKEPQETDNRNVLAAFPGINKTESGHESKFEAKGTSESAGLSTPTRKMSELSLVSPTPLQLQNVKGRTSAGSMKSLNGISSARKKKKHPIHSHLDIPGSVTSSSGTATYRDRTK